MFELRWVSRAHGKEPGWVPYPFRTHPQLYAVLQYRVFQGDITEDGAMSSTEGQWSEWEDVPYDGYQGG